jgi:hypothetical protein
MSVCTAVTCKKSVSFTPAALACLV